MKILVEPERLGRLLNSSLKFGSKSGLDSTVAEFAPEGVKISDLSLEVVALKAEYNKSYFIEYKVEKEEKIPLTQTLLERLNQGFKDEKVSFEVDGNKLILKGIRESYEEPLLDKEKSAFPIKMIETEVGYLPEKFTAITQILIPVEELKTLPSAEKYHFSTTPEEQKVSIEDAGKYTKKLKPKRKIISGDLEISFDGTYLKSTIDNIVGDVWISLSPKSVILSQKTKDYQLAYLIAPIEE